MSVQDITEALKICKCYEDDEPCKQCPIREKEWDGAWEDALGFCYIQLMRQAAEVLSHTAQTLEYLETAYTGARALGDEETMIRIARAIEAFNLDVEKDCVIANKTSINRTYISEIIHDKCCPS